MPITELLEKNALLYPDEVALIEINPEHERNNALAGARGPHQSGHFTLPGGKVHTVQYLLLVVGEAHMVEHNVVALGLETLNTNIFFRDLHR